MKKKNDINKNNSNNIQIKTTKNTPDESIDNISDLKSTYFQLQYLYLKIQKSFAIQKQQAEENFNEKINEIIKLREYNFNLSTKILNMENITKIEEYFSLNYSKILSIEPKINNIIENLDDFKSNINYGLDRLYLEDNIVCDEKELNKNIILCTNSIENLIEINKEKSSQVEEIKNNYIKFINLINTEKDKLEITAKLIENHKKFTLNFSIEKINNYLEQQNEKLENNLFN